MHCCGKLVEQVEDVAPRLDAPGSRPCHHVRDVKSEETEYHMARLNNCKGFRYDVDALFTLTLLD